MLRRRNSPGNRRSPKRSRTQPLCYAQIGGLGVATFITQLLVPVLYSIFVLDLKIVSWGKVEAPARSGATLQPREETT